MISPEEKAEFERIASLSGWDIAKHFGCAYSGDSDPIQYGGFFYDPRDWERYGYASCVEFWDDPESEDTLVIQRGTIHKPDDLKPCFACIGIKPSDDIHAQIDAARAYRGIEPEGTSYPALKSFDRRHWAEWRIWRSVSDWIKALGD